MSDKRSDLETERFQRLLTAAREYAATCARIRTAMSIKPVAGEPPQPMDMAAAQAALESDLGALGHAAIEWAEMVKHRG